MTHFDFAASAGRIQEARAAGRLCSLTADAMRGRVLGAEAAWRAGLLTYDVAVRQAREAEGAAFMFGPQPVARGGRGKLLRTVVVLLALLGAAPSVAGEAPFPREGDRWLLTVQAPTSGPKVRFARVLGEPDRRGGFAVDVTCGVRDVRTGRETVTLHADGVAGRSRGGWLGGTYVAAGQPTGGFTVLEQDGLDAVVEMPPPCPTGRGDLSSGD